MEVERERNALGQIAQLGAFYNARNDQFLSQSGTAWRNGVQPKVSSVRRMAPTWEIDFEDSYLKSFAAHTIPTDLAASIVSGLVEPEGATAYIVQDHDSTQVLTASIIHSYITFQDLIFTDTLRELVDNENIRSKEAVDATHIVIGISWGAKSRLLLRSEAVSAAVNTTASKVVFQRQVQLMKQRFVNEDAIEDTSATSEQALADVLMQSDVLDGNGIKMSVDEASQFLRLMSAQIKQKNSGRAFPLSYRLLPIQALHYSGFNVRNNSSMGLAPTHLLINLIDVFDQLRHLQVDLASQQSFQALNKQYVKEDHQRHHARATHALRFIEIPRLRTNFREILFRVRSGISGEAMLSRLHSEATAEVQRGQNVLDRSERAQSRISFIASSVKKGAFYNGVLSWNAQKPPLPQIDATVYIMFLSEADIQSQSECWKDHQALLKNLLLDNNSSAHAVSLVDGNEDKTRIVMYQDGDLVCDDLLEREKSMAGKSFAECLPDMLETSDIQRPLQRRIVKVACPGRKCDGQEQHQWLCSRCDTMLEYGFSDQYMYCDCGRSLYHNFGFRCHQRREHGPDNAFYEPDVLKSLLDSLDVPDNVNILILGETGVGKSTFINAFVNYMAHDTLEAAMKYDLTSVIPCSFAFQEIDRTKSSGEIKQHRIKVGSRDEEQDGSKGDAATQRTEVYPVINGSRTIRLIDTPGIGDTRGLEFDKANMADILKTLQNYDELHGIIILVKASQTRLTVSFNFCMKELLTHLHRSAAQSMVFGFTSSRITNYTPGDAFGPLSTVLRDHADVGLRLMHETTYCFDSEGFRYLAAHKNGHDMENFDDFRRSWEQSSKETQRLLTHFTSRAPHRVRDTLSLNNARRLIQELTKPMAEVSQMVQRNLDLAKDQTKELADRSLTGDDLRKRLWLNRVQYQAVKLPEPRTVCKNPACFEVKDDGTGEQRVVTIFKTHCHAECYLSGVDVDQVAHPGLIDCAAFGGKDSCYKCSHHWQEHLHVLYELKEAKVIIEDKTIRQELSSLKTDTQVREAGIKRLECTIAEYQQEQDKLRKAAAYFCLFLKTHCITPYNDATLAYLDMLVKDEQSKIAAAQQNGISAAGNERTLAGLEADRKRHQELVKTMTENMMTNPGNLTLTETEVDSKIQELYQLKHFGNQLKDIKNGVVSAHEATYRERPVHVQRKTYKAVSPKVSPTSATKKGGAMSKIRGFFKFGRSDHSLVEEEVAGTTK